MTQNFTTLVSVLVLLVLISTGQAIAETTLISAPLSVGDDGSLNPPGLRCACTNLMAKPIEIIFTINAVDAANIGFATSSPARTIDPGSVKHYTLGGSVIAGNCNVRRVDGIKVLTKQLSCTLSAIDNNGSPIAVEPVNKKHKRKT